MGWGEPVSGNSLTGGETPECTKWRQGQNQAVKNWQVRSGISTSSRGDLDSVSSRLGSSVRKGNRAFEQDSLTSARRFGQVGREPVTGKSPGGVRTAAPMTGHVLARFGMSRQKRPWPVTCVRTYSAWLSQWIRCDRRLHHPARTAPPVRPTDTFTGPSPMPSASSPRPPATQCSRPGRGDRTGPGRGGRTGWGVEDVPAGMGDVRGRGGGVRGPSRPAVRRRGSSPAPPRLGEFTVRAPRPAVYGAGICARGRAPCHGPWSVRRRAPAAGRPVGGAEPVFGFGAGPCGARPGRDAGSGAGSNGMDQGSTTRR